MQCQIIWQLFDNIANSETPANMARSRESVRVVYPQEMKIQIQEQRSCILGINLQLCHGLHVSPVDVV